MHTHFSSPVASPGTEEQFSGALPVVLSHASMLVDDGPRCLGRVMKRLYISGRFEGRFSGFLAGPLFESISPKLRFFLPPAGESGDPLPLDDEKVRIIIMRIVDGFYQFKHNPCCDRDGYDAFVDSLQAVEHSQVDLHETLFGSPLV